MFSNTLGLLPPITQTTNKKILETVIDIFVTMERALLYATHNPLKQEHSESEDHLGQGSSFYPHITRIPNLENQHGDPDHPKNLIIVPCTIAELS